MYWNAVHLVSSSGDHYNFLLQAEDPEHLVKQLRDTCPDFAYMDQVFVDSEEGSKSSEYETALDEAIEAAYQKENED